MISGFLQLSATMFMGVAGTAELPAKKDNILVKTLNIHYQPHPLVFESIELLPWTIIWHKLGSRE